MDVLPTPYRKKRVNTELAAGELVDATLKSIFGVPSLASRGTESNVAWGVTSYTPWNDAFATLQKVEVAGAVLIALEKQSHSCAFYGLTAVAPDFAIATPSVPSNALYVEYLEQSNRGLEVRVGQLEATLADMQRFMPTIKKIVNDYTAASSKADVLMRALLAKRGTRGSLEIAREKDALTEPPKFDVLEDFE